MEPMTATVLLISTIGTIVLFLCKRNSKQKTVDQYRWKNS